MLRRDLITAEIQKLAKVLARIAGLKAEGKIEEERDLTDSILKDEFDLNPQQINSISPSDFEKKLFSKNYSPEELHILSKVIFNSALPLEHKNTCTNRLRLVLIIYDKIEKVYHTQSLENLAIRSDIEKFLNSK